MAHSHEGAELTEQNRVAQASITAALVSAIRQLFFRTINVDDIDGTAPEFIRQAMPLVLASQQVAYETALTYLEHFREVELKAVLKAKRPSTSDRFAVPRRDLQQFLDPTAVVDFGGRDPKEDLTPPATIARDLHLSGAVAMKTRIGKGMDVEEAKRKSADGAAVKAMRHVADAGRAPLLAEVRTGNRGAVGYARVVDKDPCPFCAMLASRGAVYRSDSFDQSDGLFSGDNKFKVHDGCECTLEPVYGRSITDLPKGSAELAKQWAEIASGRPDAFKVWSRFRNSGTLPDDSEDHTNSTTRKTSSRAKAKSTKRQGPKKISEITDPIELRKRRDSLEVRLHGLEREIEDLKARGVTSDQPGIAKTLPRLIKKTRDDIDLIDKRLDMMEP